MNILPGYRQRCVFRRQPLESVNALALERPIHECYASRFARTVMRLAARAFLARLMRVGSQKLALRCDSPGLPRRRFLQHRSVHDANDLRHDLVRCRSDIATVMCRSSPPCAFDVECPMTVSLEEVRADARR